jgi:hypothetical protein
MVRASAAPRPLPVPVVHDCHLPVLIFPILLLVVVVVVRADPGVFVVFSFRHVPIHGSGWR